VPAQVTVTVKILLGVHSRFHRRLPSTRTMVASSCVILKTASLLWAAWGSTLQAGS
jgi:hypothetical protein